MTLNEAFAIRVRELLKEKKITQYRIEQDTGLYHSTLTYILNNSGKTKSCNFKSMALVIRSLGMTMTNFFNHPVFNFDELNID